MDHPIAPDSLARFLAGGASREENRRVVAHLLKGCPLCAQRVEELLVEPEPDEEHGYDAAFDRFERVAVPAKEPSAAKLPALALLPL